MRKGNVKWFNSQKGYGFIRDSEGNDVFVYHTQIQMEGFRHLDEGDYVQFEVEKTETSNREQAVKVVPVLTLNMVKEALKKENLHLDTVKNGVGDKVWTVADENNVIQSSEQGMYFLELAAFAGFDVEELQ